MLMDSRNVALVVVVADPVGVRRWLGAIYIVEVAVLDIVVEARAPAPVLDVVVDSRASALVLNVVVGARASAPVPPVVASSSPADPFEAAKLQ